MGGRFKVLLSATIVGVVVALALLGCQTDDSTPDATLNPGNLFTSNRTHLSLCVDHAGESSASAEVLAPDVDRVSEAITRALDTLDPLPREFGKPSVTAGCPPPIPLTGQQITFLQLHVDLAKAVHDPAEVSPHRILVYFVADGLYDMSFDTPRPYQSATAELLCEKNTDTCGEVTVAVYVRETIGEKDLPNALLSGLALDPRTPQPTIDWPGCEHGTPRPECERYLDCLGAATEDLNCRSFWEEVATPRPR